MGGVNIMTEKDVGSQAVPLLCPPPHVASQFTVMATPAEFLLVLGHGRPAFKPGTTELGLVVEWTATYSLGPVAAKQLAGALKEAVDAWEKQQKYVIPIDAPKLEQKK